MTQRAKTTAPSGSRGTCTDARRRSARHRRPRRAHLPSARRLLLAGASTASRRSAPSIPLPRRWPTWIRATPPAGRRARRWPRPKARSVCPTGSTPTAARRPKARPDAPGTRVRSPRPPLSALAMPASTSAMAMPTACAPCCSGGWRTRAGHADDRPEARARPAADGAGRSRRRGAGVRPVDAAQPRGTAAPAGARRERALLRPSQGRPVPQHPALQAHASISTRACAPAC